MQGKATGAPAGVKRLVIMLSESFKEALCERDAEIVDTVRQHLVTPILQQVYKDLLPYAVGAAAVALALLVLIMGLLCVQLLTLFRAPAAGS